MQVSVRHWLLILSVATLAGCSNSNNSLQTNEGTGRIDQGLATKYVHYSSPVEEYVNRIGKRVLMVSDHPSTHYQFLVGNNDTELLTLDATNNSIVISRALLQQLNDEAELAAILSLSMAKLSHDPNIDSDTITYLYRAGYDPQALIDLQEQYLYSTSAQTSHWLQVIYPAPLSAGTITYNKMLINKFPRGLQRDPEDYRQQINS